MITIFILDVVRLTTRLFFFLYYEHFIIKIHCGKLLCCCAAIGICAITPSVHHVAPRLAEGGNKTSKTVRFGGS
jgi:hypothetical protein